MNVIFRTGKIGYISEVDLAQAQQIKRHQFSYLMQSKGGALPKQYSQEMGRRHEQTFLQRRQTNGQQTHKKMLNITWHQGNTDQNNNEILHHTGQND